MKSLFRNPYDQESEDKICNIGIDYSNDPGMTLQAPAEEQDLNVIMKRFGVTDGSKLPRWHDPQAIYGDFSEMPTDPAQAAEYLRQGEIAFATLPADLRVRFQTGADLYNWMEKEENYEEAVKIGILRRVDTQATTETPPPAPE